MSRENQEMIRDARRWVHESRDLMRKVVLMRWAHALLLTVGVTLGLLTLSWRVRDEVFGRTATFRSSGTHAPSYTRTEFEQEFIRRVRERGFMVEGLRIKSQNYHNQFDFEITLLRVPSSISDYDVLNHLRQVSESMQDKALPVEK